MVLYDIFFFRHFSRYHLFFVSKLVGLHESIASIENTICCLIDIRFPAFKVAILVY